MLLPYHRAKIRFRSVLVNQAAIQFFLSSAFIKLSLCPHYKPFCQLVDHYGCFSFFSRYEYLFNFDNTFEIHDDIEVLKRMGLTLGLESGQSSQEDINKAISLVPRSLERYVRDIARNASDKNQANSAR